MTDEELSQFPNRDYCTQHGVYSATWAPWTIEAWERNRLRGITLQE